MALAVGISSGAAALQIRREILQMVELSDMTSPNKTFGYQRHPHSDYLLRDKENHTYQHENSTVTQHSRQDESVRPQHHHRQELLSSLVSPVALPQIAHKNPRVCPTEIGIKVRALCFLYMYLF